MNPVRDSSSDGRETTERGPEPDGGAEATEAMADLPPRERSTHLLLVAWKVLLESRRKRATASPSMERRHRSD